ncbi:Ribonuclease H domain [Dillenia turbinata]|uniref:Ribonuclease H domain n=1 Tax=Dillenia turbinata TaxID=194707 RepID=A0AAN8V7M2_9MAGN
MFHLIVHCLAEPETVTSLKALGFASGYPGAVGAGGFIRDHYGRRVVGFTCNLCRAASTQVELWQLRDALPLAVEKGFERLSIQVEFQSSFELVIQS